MLEIFQDHSKTFRHVTDAEVRICCNDAKSALLLSYFTWIASRQVVDPDELPESINLGPINQKDLTRYTSLTPGELRSRIPWFEEQGYLRVERINGSPSSFFLERAVIQAEYDKLAGLTRIHPTAEQKQQGYRCKNSRGAGAKTAGVPVQKQQGYRCKNSRGTGAKTAGVPVQKQQGYRCKNSRGTGADTLYTNNKLNNSSSNNVRDRESENLSSAPSATTAPEKIFESEFERAIANERMADRGKRIPYHEAVEDLKKLGFFDSSGKPTTELVGEYKYSVELESQGRIKFSGTVTPSKSFAFKSSVRKRTG